MTICYAAHCNLAGYCSSMMHVMVSGTTVPFVVCLYFDALGTQGCKHHCLHSLHA
jgi:hypothetical protein